MRRYLTEYIQKDLKIKTILVSGPRQVRNTTLARELIKGGEYLNFHGVSDPEVSCLKRGEEMLQ